MAAELTEAEGIEREMVSRLDDRFAAGGGGGREEECSTTPTAEGGAGRRVRAGLLLLALPPFVVLGSLVLMALGWAVAFAVMVGAAPPRNPGASGAGALVTVQVVGWAVGGAVTLVCYGLTL